MNMIAKIGLVLMKVGMKVIEETVDKWDSVYILGDLTFLKSDDARHLLEKLPGRKYLIEGNHDGSIRAYENYFVSVNQVLDIVMRLYMRRLLRRRVRMT